MAPELKLAASILAYDEDHPGEPDAEMCVDAETWSEWIDLVGEIERQNGDGL